MKQKRVLAGLGVASLAVLAGCAAPGYGGGYGAGYGGGGGYAPAPAYGGQPQQPGALYGRVESIEPMPAPANSPGILGTIIGGVAGGVLGHQIGGGTGNTVATIGGAALGALAGNQVERAAGAGGQTVYRVMVRLDDGRVATVTQRNPNNLRVGDRAMVANDQATPSY
ncbi:glycine zipper 2TM domain-containing protein [Ralstonia solanacearum P673]|uniref:glycine zipper 2TM domain-containing protein n=1 Tax=Ralstonia solanacearum TaxID=305 RepID=UPI00044DB02F|nr:glycine zipper 2TM domain-containing protein [Ralstonia solanacearum]EUJ14295.1 membrane protein [Ralstonia solanacearum P673]MCL9847409.1 glycine zipper 2TM domain-containing protein [Ralstonia solanacearum]MCL9852944.1 glycine zipper 2TM domain-containing protein [Ralstonia solanacearum]MCL9858209.1 glycine zipper 2TM domain-containing protein [Ralstonia solanacearum]MCL9862179.1 glycine zipper 2TM domain-containing protein [Ralstonia solanacearum]